jgi:HPt (histidine-containing phosphotransfer) domain-containing protein
MENDFSADALQRAVGGNVELARRVAEAFLRIRPELQARLTGAVRAQDLSAARRAAHELRGMAGMMGAKQLAQTATAIEARTADPQADWASGDAAVLLRDLNTEWEAVVRVLGPLAPHVAPHVN